MVGWFYLINLFIHHHVLIFDFALVFVQVIKQFKLDIYIYCKKQHNLSPLKSSIRVIL